MKESPNLDLLRSIAVSFVLFAHLRRPLFPGIPDGVIGQACDWLGGLGVAIFFTHTSLVLMHSMERTGPAPLPFYVRRAFRIYPLAIAIVCVFALLAWAKGMPYDAKAFLSNLLLIQNLTGAQSWPAPLWSLPYEVQMYLVLPVLFLLTRSRRPVACIAALWVCAVLGALALGETDIPPGNLGFHPLRYIPCFLPGVVAYALRHRAPSFGPWLLFSLVACGAAMLPVIAWLDAPLAPFLWCFCAALGLVIPLCREIASATVARGGKLVATYSYGVYLTHPLAIVVTFAAYADAPAVERLAALALLLTVLPFACYHLIEAPGIALGKRLTANYKARICAPRPAAMSPAASSAPTPDVVRELVRSTTEAALSNSR